MNQFLILIKCQSSLYDLKKKCIYVHWCGGWHVQGVWASSFHSSGSENTPKKHKLTTSKNLSASFYSVVFMKHKPVPASVDCVPLRPALLWLSLISDTVARFSAWRTFKLGDMCAHKTRRVVRRRCGHSENSCESESTPSIQFYYSSRPLLCLTELNSAFLFFAAGVIWFVLSKRLLYV